MSSDPKNFVLVSVRAQSVDKNPDGTFSIEVEATPITEQQDRVLSQLFPHLREQAYDLLNKEALLAAMNVR